MKYEIEMSSRFKKDYKLAKKELVLKNKISRKSHHHKKWWLFCVQTRIYEIQWQTPQEY